MNILKTDVDHATLCATIQFFFPVTYCHMCN